MSIFTLPIHSIDDTRIYVSSSQETPDRQLTMICHTIDTTFLGNTFIIPVPHPHTVKIHHLDNGASRDFLNALGNAFDRGRYAPRVTPPFFTADHAKPRGHYRVKFIGTKEEFQDYTNEYQVAHPQLVAQLLSHYYERHWGFLVVEIQEGYYEYEPLVYSHLMRDKLFFLPTLHHYPETIRDQDIPEESSRWDHTLFINGSYHEDDPKFQEVNPMRLNRIPWGVLPKGFQQAFRHLVMKKIRGHRPNFDTTAASRIHDEIEGGRLGVDK